MHGLVRVIPKPEEKKPTPQCCVQVRESDTSQRGYWNSRRLARAHKKGLDPLKCQFSSTHVVDGKPYCTTHAAAEALRILENYSKE